MACCLVALCLMAPRLALAIMYFATDYFRAFQTWYWPLLGFFFMPLTTLAYMAAMLNNNNMVSGWWLVLLIVAVFGDLGSHSGAASKNRRPRPERNTR